MTPGDSGTSARKRRFSCVVLILSTTSASYAQSRTSCPLLDRRSASAVPHAPAPITAQCMSPRGFASETVFLAAPEPHDVGTVGPEDEQCNDDRDEQERRCTSRQVHGDGQND